MPWSCKTCEATSPGGPEYSDDWRECPSCGTAKDAWTLPAGGKTRRFVVPGKKLELLVGPGTDRRTRAAGWSNEELAAAERAVALRVEVVGAWAGDRRAALPPAARTLLVRCWTADPTVEVVLTAVGDGGSREADRHTWAAPTEVDGKPCHEARYVLVHGVKKGQALPSFDDTVRVVDLGDGDGPAHELQVTACGKTSTLPVDPLDLAIRLECETVQFNVDSYLLLPAALDAIERALRYAHEQRETRRLVVAGHTDSQDDPDDNLTLAANRCANIVAMLRPRARGRAEWADSAGASYAKLVAKPHDPVAGQDRDAVSKWAAGRWKKTYTGFDGVYSAWVTLMLQKGDTRSKVVVEGTGDARWSSSGAWEAVYDLYEAALEDRVARRNVELGRYDADAPTLEQMRAAVVFAHDHHPGVACGEYHLKVRGAGTGAGLAADDGVDEPANRRIEFLFFPAATPPWDSRTQTDDDAGERSRREALYGPSDRDVETNPRWEYSAPGPWIFEQMDCCDQPGLIPVLVDTVFLIDYTESMIKDDPARMGHCRTILKQAITHLGEDRRFAVLGFERNGTVWQPSGTQTGALLPATLQNIRDACLWVDKLDPRGALPIPHESDRFIDAAGQPWLADGETNLGQALHYALEQYPCRLVVLSDGSPNVGIQNEVRLLEEVARLNAASPGRVVDTFGFLTSQPLLTPAGVAAAGSLYAARLQAGWSVSPSTAPAPECVKSGVLGGSAGVDQRDFRYVPVLAPSVTDWNTYELSLTHKETTIFKDVYDVLAATPTNLVNPGQPYDRTTMAPAMRRALLGWLLEQLATRNGGTFTDVYTALGLPHP